MFRFDFGQPLLRPTWQAWRARWKMCETYLSRLVQKLRSIEHWRAFTSSAACKSFEFSGCHSAHGSKYLVSLLFWFGVSSIAAFFLTKQAADCNQQLSVGGCFSVLLLIFQSMMSWLKWRCVSCMGLLLWHPLPWTFRDVHSANVLLDRVPKKVFWSVPVSERKVFDFILINHALAHMDPSLGDPILQHSRECGTLKQPVHFQNAWMEQRPRSSSMAHCNAVQMSLCLV